jgi:hypothetical protein
MEYFLQNFSGYAGSPDNHLPAGSASQDNFRFEKKKNCAVYDNQFAEPSV